jgi:dolichyl-phosphate beta-glucosyltransferase
MASAIFVPLLPAKSDTIEFMDAAPFLSIIIPAYNEAERIPLTLLDMDKRLAEAGFSYEILVVNDGSTDTTVDIVEKMTKAIPHLKLLNDKKNQGKGGVVRQGMLAAKGIYRIFSDADNSTSIDQFEKMLPFFKEGYEVVIGSRAARGAQLDPPQPFYKELLGRLSNLIIQLVNLPGIWDSQCGFKALTAEAAERIFSQTRINGWGFDIEVLALARSFGYRVKEVPVHWVNDLGSHVKLSAYLKVFIENVKIRWWLMLGSYKPAPKPLK